MFLMCIALIEVLPGRRVFIHAIDRIEYASDSSTAVELCNCISD